MPHVERLDSSYQRAQEAVPKKKHVTNKKAASTVIGLCAVAIFAVLMIHNETTTVSEHGVVSDSLSAGSMQPMEFQNADYLASEDTMFLQAKQPRSVAPASTVSRRHRSALAPEDTLVDMDLAAKWGRSNQVRQRATKAALDAASNEFEAGLPLLSAGHAASEAATDVVRSAGAKELQKSSLFADKIAAATFAAEVKALKALEAGEGKAVAQEAAKHAAQGVVLDHGLIRAKLTSVPDSLEQLLKRVDQLWKSQNAEHPTMTLLGVSSAKCGETRRLVADSFERMGQATAQAKTHLAKAKAPLRSDGDVAQEAHLAVSFLKLAGKHRERASAAALRCEVERALTRFDSLPADLQTQTVASSSGKGMMASLAMMMDSAARAAAKRSYDSLDATGNSPQTKAKEAAATACNAVLKKVARQVAHRSSRATATPKKIPNMQKAILLVLRAGRPMVDSIVSDAVTSADEVYARMKASNREIPMHMPPPVYAWPTAEQEGSALPASVPQNAAKNDPWPSYKPSASKKKKMLLLLQQQQKEAIRETRLKQVEAKRRLTAARRAEQAAQKNEAAMSEFIAAATRTAARQARLHVKKKGGNKPAQLKAATKAAAAAAQKAVAEWKMQHSSVHLAAPPIAASMSEFIAQVTATAAKQARQRIKKLGGNKEAQLRAANKAATAAAEMAATKWKSVHSN